MNNRFMKPCLIFFMPCLLFFLLSCATATRADVTLAVPQVNLPKDELPHPAAPVEWWYYAGHLQDAQGRTYGVMASFFTAKMGNLPTNHFMIYALTEKTEKKFHSGSIIQKSMIDIMRTIADNPPPALKKMVGPDFFDLDNVEKHHAIMKEKPVVMKDQLAIKYEENFFRKTKGNDRNFTGWEYRTKITGSDFSYSLTMVPARGPMFVNGIGNVGLSESEDMYYYSFTRLDTTGTISVNGETREVTGTIWYDHQFGSMAGPEDPVGWDWFCLQLEDGTDMNLSALRKLRTGERFNRLGTIQRADGRVSVVHDLIIEPLDSWTSPDTGITYPSGWKLALPSLNTSFTVKPDLKGQEMRAFGPFRAIWEGSCTVEGVVDGVVVKGLAYTELVGYAFKPVE